MSHIIIVTVAIILTYTAMHTRIIIVQSSIIHCNRVLPTLFCVNRCFSFIGRVRGPQDISIGQGCEFKGIVIHEMFHALGRWHEQSRPDRDQFVRINTQNIQSGRQVATIIMIIIVVPPPPHARGRSWVNTILASLN